MIQLDPIEFSTCDNAKKHIAILNQEFQNGSGLAGFSLGTIFSESNCLMSDEIKSIIGASDQKALDYFTKSFELLKLEAQAGNGEAMHLIAIYYQSGMPPVSPDKHQFKMWTDKAASAGCVVLDDLLAIYADKKSEFYDPIRARDLRNLI